MCHIPQHILKTAFSYAYLIQSHNTVGALLLFLYLIPILTSVFYTIDMVKFKQVPELYKLVILITAYNKSIRNKGKKQHSGSRLDH